MPRISSQKNKEYSYKWRLKNNEKYCATVRRSQHWKKIKMIFLAILLD